MALVRYGGGIVGMSGSIAGDTFARNRYGNYSRARTKPINPNTAIQVKCRSVISYLSEYWYTDLSNAQRTAWGVYASNVAMKNKLGEVIYLSGFNHFIRGNAPRAYQNLAVVEAGPVVFTLPSKDEQLVIDVDEDPQQISVTWDDGRDWCAETGAFMSMRQGLPQNVTRNYFGGPYRNVGIVHGGAIPYTPPWLVAPAFAVAVGQRCWCAFRISRADGRLSEIFYAQDDVHGQTPGEVPMILGITQAAAVVILTSPEVQLILGTVTEEHSAHVPVGLIISTDPVAHTRLEIGDPVNIVVSLGPVP